MLQRRLGPPRRLGPGLSPHPSFPSSRTLSRPRPTHPPVHAPTGEERRRDVNCFQSRAKLARKCSTLACIRRVCTRVCACRRGTEARRDVAGGSKRARMFLDSIASRYYVDTRSERGRENGGGRRGTGGGKIHYLSHSGARALSGAI